MSNEPEALVFGVDHSAVISNHNVVQRRHLGVHHVRLREQQTKFTAGHGALYSNLASFQNGIIKLAHEPIEASQMKAPAFHFCYPNRTVLLCVQ